MKRQLLIATVCVLFGACSTNYIPYHGASPTMGTGGACVSKNGIDIWIEGSPPRKYIVIGVIEDERSDDPIAMSGRDSKIAATVREHGGDAAILSDQTRLLDSATTTGTSSSRFETDRRNDRVTSGTSFDQSRTSLSYRRTARYYVVKYL